MNTREVADHLNTDPKRLRRFLRADPTYRNAGQGGRYEFTKKDMATLEKRFSAWCAENDKKKRTTDKPAAAGIPTPRAKKELSDDAPMSSGILGRRLSTKEREERDRLSRERVDRLEYQLMAAGLHISQRKV